MGFLHLGHGYLEQRIGFTVISAVAIHPFWTLCWARAMMAMICFTVYDLRMAYICQFSILLFLALILYEVHFHPFLCSKRREATPPHA